MLTLLSPAKVNLFLRILHRRDDGFHELASLFQAIDLCDTLHIKCADRETFSCTDPSIPVDERNLIIKAANLFRKKVGIDQKLWIHAEKRIPQQAGLGGGSSNAATTLWAFNQLCGHPATEEQLISWGAEIGSDVAFFLSQGTAYCTGRGEKLRFLPSLPPTHLWVIKPPQGLSTPQIYGRLDPNRLLKRDPEEALRSFTTTQPIFFNDLEIPAFEVMPDLAALKQKLLQAGFTEALMSGSGSSFFCMGDGVLPRIPGYVSCSARFINRKARQWYTQAT